MPRELDIPYAFTLAVIRNQRGLLTVTTSVFRTELHKLNHDWSLQRCNDWISRKQTFFKDITDGDGTDRIYVLRNMGRIL